MRMTSSVGIGHRKAVGNLANGVGIRVSLTLAIESKMMVTSISSITSVSTIETSIASIATVTNGSISRDKAMAVINSS